MDESGYIASDYFQTDYNWIRSKKNHALELDFKINLKLSMLFTIIAFKLPFLIRKKVLVHQKAFKV